MLGIEWRGRGGGAEDCNMVGATEVEQGNGKGEGTREDKAVAFFVSLPMPSVPLDLRERVLVVCKGGSPV